MPDLLDLWDYLVPCIMLFYGIKWLISAPEFGSSKGLATKYAKMSEENWKLAHSFGGKLCVIFGAVMLALVIAKNFIKDGDVFKNLTFVTVGVNLVLIFSLIPLVNLYIKKKMQ